MIYLSPGNKWSIPTILNEIENKPFIEFLYRDNLGRIQKGKQNKKLMFKTLFRCGTKCTHCKKEGLHFELSNGNFLRIATVDGFLNVEHIIPQSLGGTDIEYNVTIFCNICNESKGNKLLVPNKTNKVKNIRIKNVIGYGKFLKKYLMEHLTHEEAEKIFKSIYNTRSSFKINSKNLNKYIEKFNIYCVKNNINLILKEEDIPLCYITGVEL